MSRREVLEITCDRCSKTETQNHSEVNSASIKHEFSGSYLKETVEYSDLCRRCRGTVKNYFDKIRRVKDEDEPTEVFKVHTIP